jgi:hypothetical protein
MSSNLRISSDMNPLLFFGLYYAALFVSCHSTTETCPVIHKSSELMIREHTLTYRHVIGYCEVEGTIYSADSNTIQEWIKANPDRLAYHTMWGSVGWESMLGMYIIHVFLGIVGVGIWIIIEDEKNRNRRR